MTPWTAACQASLSFTISWSLPKFISIASLMLSSHLILWCSLFLLPSVLASGTSQISQLFASDVQNTWASASASVLPTGIQGWFPLRLTALISLPVQGPLRSLLQYHSLKALILWHSAFFTVQLSQPYVTTGRTPVCLPYLLSYEVTSNISNINAKYKRHWPTEEEGTHWFSR